MPTGDDDFKRGELFATVKNINENTTAIRNKLDSIEQRVSGLESRESALKAEREVMIEAYDDFRTQTKQDIHKLSNSLQKVVSLENAVTNLKDALTKEAELRRDNEKKVQGLLDDKNQLKGVLLSVKVAWGVILLLTGVVTTQAWIDHRESQNTQAQIEALKAQSH